MTDEPAPHAALPHLSRSLVLVMASASGLSVANLYYNQPLLADIARSFHVSAGEVGFIPMLAQLGYALGLFLFVPLGDMTEQRRLILIMLGAVTAALAAIAVAPGLAWLGVASLIMGATTIVPQLLLPLAANLAAPEERGRVIGSVMSGLLIGILLARTVSGFVGAHLGWRAMYWLAAGTMIALAIALRALLPLAPAARTASYPALLRSLWTLVREQPALREASLFGALIFGAFSAFWATLVFFLAQPPYQRGSEAAGLFGLIGVVGALAAPIVGRIADRKSPRLAAGIAQAIVLASFALFWAFGRQLWGLIAGVILLDLGTQANQVANQTRIYALLPGARNRVNTVYMVSYFIGGALGTLLATQAWGRWQWSGVCAVGAIASAAALAVRALNRPATAPR